MGGKLLNGERIASEDVPNLVKEIMTGYDVRYEIAGSYRRGKPDVGDIDIVVCVHPDNLYAFNIKIQQEYGCL